MTTTDQPAGEPDTEGSYGASTNFAADFSSLTANIATVIKGKSTDSGDVRPLDVKVGDNVLFGKYSGTEVKVDGEDLLVMREEDIMAVID